MHTLTGNFVAKPTQRKFTTLRNRTWPTNVKIKRAINKPRAEGCELWEPRGGAGGVSKVHALRSSLRVDVEPREFLFITQPKHDEGGWRRWGSSRDERDG